MKPTATNPAPDNVDTLLEVPDFAFLLCVMGGTDSRVPDLRAARIRQRERARGIDDRLRDVGDDGLSSTASLCSTYTGEAGGRASSSPTSIGSADDPELDEHVPLSNVTPRAPSSRTRASRDLRAFRARTGTSTRDARGALSFALPFPTTTNRVELWKGSPGASGSRLLYAQNSSAAPQVTGFTVGNVIPFLLPGRKPARARVPAISQAVETLSAQTDAPTTPTTITPSSSLSTTVSFGNSFSSISDVCVNWYFVGDLFDPGETVSVTLGNNGGGGAGNIVGGVTPNAAAMHGSSGR